MDYGREDKKGVYHQQDTLFFCYICPELFKIC